VELRKTYQLTKRDLEFAFYDLAETIARVVELKDPYTAGHQRRVAELARTIGTALQLHEKDIDTLYFAGLLHDVGKVNISNDILSKPTKLSKIEYMIIQEHSQTGYEIIRNTRLPFDISGIILQHHEKLDGSGYPNGISGEQIGLMVRIITVCDVVEAMSTFRPYRPARTQSEVVKELRDGQGIKYDLNVVEIMLSLIESGQFDPWNAVNIL
jgi:putative nucleotidyltransferase with HDIG domain